MPRYKITLAPPPEDADAGRTWIEDGPRQLSVGDDVLENGRWVRLMRNDEPVAADSDGAFVAATALPIGGILVAGRMLDIYREDAKTLLAELAADPARAGAADAMTMLERMIRDEPFDGDLGDKGTAAILSAAEGAANHGVASAPLIRLGATLRELVQHNG